MMDGPAYLREFAPTEPGAIMRSPARERIIADDAHSRGFDEGMAQARREIDLDTLAALRDLTARLDDMVAMRADVMTTLSAEAGTVLSTVIRRIAPDIAAQGVADRARQLLENQLRDAPRPLTISVAPDVAERLGAVMADISEPDFAIEAVETMPRTRIEASWPEGGATVDADALVARILDLAADLAPADDSMEEKPHD